MDFPDEHVSALVELGLSRHAIEAGFECITLDTVKVLVLTLAGHVR
jgi:hypothetical protein